MDEKEKKEERRKADVGRERFRRANMTDAKLEEQRLRSTEAAAKRRVSISELQVKQDGETNQDQVHAHRSARQSEKVEPGEYRSAPLRVELRAATSPKQVAEDG